MTNVRNVWSVRDTTDSTEQLMEKFPTFYENQRSWSRWKESPTCPCLEPDEPSLPFPSYTFRFILLIFSNLRLDRRSFLLPSRSLIKTLYTFPFVPTHATCIVHLILFDFIARVIFGEYYTTRSPSLYRIH